MKENNLCPICKSQIIPNSEPRYSGGAYQEFNCPRCGVFRLDYSLLSNLETYLQLVKNGEAILSHWVRLRSESYNSIITTDVVKKILETKTLPSPNEQLENLLLYLGNHAKKPSDSVDCKPIQVVSIIGAVDTHDVTYHLLYLNRNKLIYIIFPVLGDPEFDNYSDLFIIQLTHEGWTKYYELQRSNKDSRLAFMAMKYGDEQLDSIFNEIIKDAVSKTGFEIRKLDEEKRAGSIDDKLRVEIRKSKFLIADLTHDNNGAYWEAGYAEGLSMPVIYICEEEKFKASKSHFDTNHNLTLRWKDDESGLEKFADELKATIRATFPAEAKIDD